MKIHYYRSACGAGKSYNAAQRIVNCIGRYLVVRDRIAAIQEFATNLASLAMSASRSLPIATITNREGASVRLQVEDIPNTYDSIDHICVLITHKAMLMCDFSQFEGWHVIIDETPVVFDNQELQTSQSREFFERNYALAPVHRHWSSATLTRDGWDVSPADLERDDCFRLLRVFHERVTAATELPEQNTQRMLRRSHRHDASRPAVIGNIREWSDMEDGRRWTWWSVWSPHQLDAFASIEIMANAFDKSLTFNLLRTLNPAIEWEEVKLQNARQFAPRHVVIEYFAANHVGSQSMFDSAEGQANLRAIARHLSSRDQIWMANSRHDEHLKGIGGMQLQPKQAGSNRYAHVHAATAIYTAKPSQDTRTILELLGIDPEVWTETNEHEAILQFMTRLSIRDPQSTSTVTMTVYDHAQAGYLARYFRDQPYCTVTVSHIDLALTDRPRKVGRPHFDMSVEEADAKKAADKSKRARDARERRAKAKTAKAVA